MPLLSIIILTYNSSSDIQLCLSSILKQYEKELEKGEFELIVSDNNSSDNTADVIKSLKHDKIKFFQNNNNSGFAKGQNQGASHATGKYLFFLNPDAQVLDTEIVDMVSYLEKQEDVGIIGGKVLQENDEAELSAGKFYTPWNVFFLTIGLEELFGVRYSPASIQLVDFVSGGFMMIRADLFWRLHGFDEHYFMYVEDMDICYRASKMGYKTAFYPQAQAKHKGQGSSSRSFAIEHIYRGLLYFYKKHRTSQEFKIVKLLLIVKARVAIIIGRAFGKRNLVTTYSQARKTIR